MQTHRVFQTWVYEFDGYQATEAGVNPLWSHYYRRATDHYTAIQWMGGLLHLVQQGGAQVGWGTTHSPPRCTKCNSPPNNGQCTNFILFDVALTYVHFTRLSRETNRFNSCTSLRTQITSWVIKNKRNYKTYLRQMGQNDASITPPNLPLALCYLEPPDFQMITEIKPVISSKKT